jgi:multidrug efflux pump
MTVVLIAVYIPIGFQGGLTGALFTEFAFTLAGAVTVSAIIALCLSPMMCSRFLKASHGSSRFVQFIDRQFERLHASYERRLHGALETWIVLIVMGAMIFGGTVFLFMNSQSELAPQEDQGFVVGIATGAPNASPAQVKSYMAEMQAITKSIPEVHQTFQISGVAGPNSILTGAKLVPWGERSRNATEIQNELQGKWGAMAATNAFAFQFPSLPGAQGQPVEVVLSTTEPFENLYEVSKNVLDKLQSSGKFWFIDTNRDRQAAKHARSRSRHDHRAGPDPAGRRRFARRRARWWLRSTTSRLPVAHIASFRRYCRPIA